ncbi:hypothetical protein J4448_06285 [Candidatus Woesearchaeota archaeon]|nr:hypothetical protein [Candidatus Woesearchaeota archaeon]
MIKINIFEKNNTVAVRTLDNKVYFDVKADELLKKISENVENKKQKFDF